MGNKRLTVEFVFNFFFIVLVLTLIIAGALTAYTMTRPVSETGVYQMKPNVSFWITEIVFYGFFVGLFSFSIMLLTGALKLHQKFFTRSQFSPTKISLRSNLLNITFVAGVLLILGAGIVTAVLNSQEKGLEIASVNLEPSPSPSPEIKWKSEVLKLINEERINNKISGLFENLLLTKSSNFRSNYVISSQDWSTNPKAGNDYVSLIEKEGYKAEYMAESMAYGFSTPGEAFQALMKDATNKKNILNPNFRDVGITVKKGKVNSYDFESEIIVIHFAGEKTVEPIIPQKNTTQKSDPDPIIDCQFSTVGTVKLKKSVCSITFECQIGGPWYLYTDKNKCLEDQKKYASGGKVTNPTITNYVPLPSVSFQEGLMSCPVYNAQSNSTQYLLLKITECTQKVNEQNRLNDEYYVARNQSIQQTNELEQQHQDACYRAVAEWDTIKAQFWADEGNKYGSSADAVFALERYRQNYQNQLDSAGCNRKIYL